MKLKEQENDVTDQTQAQEQTMMITGNEQNDEEISEVFLYIRLAAYSLGITHTKLLITCLMYANILLCMLIATALTA